MTVCSSSGLEATVLDLVWAMEARREQLGTWTKFRKEYGCRHVRMDSHPRSRSWYSLNSDGFLKERRLLLTDTRLVDAHDRSKWVICVKDMTFPYEVDLLPK